MHLYLIVFLIIGFTVAVASQFSERDKTVQKIEGKVKEVIDKASSGAVSPGEISSETKQIKAEMKNLPKDDRNKVKSFTLQTADKTLSESKRMDSSDSRLRQKRFVYGS